MSRYFVTCRKCLGSGIRYYNLGDLKATPLPCNVCEGMGSLPPGQQDD